MKDTKRRLVEEELVRGLARSDRVGSAERASVVKGMLMAVDTLDELAHDSLDNYRYLTSLLDSDDDLDDQMPADGGTIDALVNIIYAGRKNTYALRLENYTMPALKQFWDERLKDQELYRPLTWNDDVNLEGIKDWKLEARCGLCGQVFFPLKESFVGLNSQQMGLYEHYQKMTDAGERECGGYGLITGGYKGLERIQK